MNRIKIAWRAALALAAATLAQGTFAGQIGGSAHDFRNQAWGNGQICIYCHAPHHTDTTTTDAPLWNHEVTSQTYVLYDSATLDATVGQPGGLSKLCLSCHDGTVAPDSFGGTGGSAPTLSGSANLGNTLLDDHPIGFVYDTSLSTTDGSLHDPVATNVTSRSAAGSRTT